MDRGRRFEVVVVNGLSAVMLRVGLACLELLVLPRQLAHCPQLGDG